MVGIEVPGILLLIIGGCILCCIAGAIIWFIEWLGSKISPIKVLSEEEFDKRHGRDKRYDREDENPNDDEGQSI